MIIQVLICENRSNIKTDEEESTSEHNTFYLFLVEQFIKLFITMDIEKQASTISYSMPPINWLIGS
jgi:hypothetical protein